MTIPRCRKATLNLQFMATLASHVRHGPSQVRHGPSYVRHGPSQVGAPKVHSTGAKTSTEEFGHKQISHNKLVGRFQIQGFHIELSMGVLRNFKLNSAKCRTTMTSQDHM